MHLPNEPDCDHCWDVRIDFTGTAVSTRHYRQRKKWGRLLAVIATAVVTGSGHVGYLSEKQLQEFEKEFEKWQHMEEYPTELAAQADLLREMLTEVAQVTSASFRVFPRRWSITRPYQQTLLILSSRGVSWILLPVPAPTPEVNGNVLNRATNAQSPRDWGLRFCPSWCFRKVGLDPNPIPETHPIGFRI